MILTRETERTITLEQPNRVLQRLLTGAVSGLFASGPMAILMLVFKQFLPKREQYPVPPRIITEEITDRAHVSGQLGREGIAALTWLAHFGYGAAAGAAYPFIFKRLPFPSIIKGSIFGMFVWTASYMGWLPAFQIMPPATRTPAGRNWMMIGSHLVWGGLVALLTDWLEELT